MTPSISFRMLTVAVALLPLTGCFEKEPAPQPSRASLLTAHPWHNSQYRLTKSDGQENIITDADLDSCTLDDIEKFNPDYTLMYDSGQILCATETERYTQATWELRDGDKVLYRKDQQTGFAWQATIDKLTEQEMVISYDLRSQTGSTTGRVTLTFEAR